jgi:hypothetical protein
MKKFVLVTITILFLSSCGDLSPAPLSTASPNVPTIITEKMMGTSTTTNTASPTGIESTATAVLTKGLAPDKLRKYIGLHYPPLPDGLSEIFGLLISDSNDYSLTLVSDGENKMLWLEKLTHRDPSGKVYWEVKDILELPKVDGDVVLIPDGCLLNKKLDSEIFVIGNVTNETILFAWRANTKLGIFEIISANGIECLTDKSMRLK